MAASRESGRKKRRRKVKKMNREEEEEEEEEKERGREKDGDGPTNFSHPVWTQLGLPWSQPRRAILISHAGPPPNSSTMVSLFRPLPLLLVPLDRTYTALFPPSVPFLLFHLLLYPLLISSRSSAIEGEKNRNCDSSVSFFSLYHPFSLSSRLLARSRFIRRAN